MRALRRLLSPFAIADRRERLIDVRHGTEHADRTASRQRQQQALGETRTLVHDKHADSGGHPVSIGTAMAPAESSTGCSLSTDARH